jgi:hypothetical protein
LSGTTAATRRIIADPSDQHARTDRIDPNGQSGPTGRNDQSGRNAPNEPIGRSGPNALSGLSVPNGRNVPRDPNVRSVRLGVDDDVGRVLLYGPGVSGGSRKQGPPYARRQDSPHPWRNVLKRASYMFGVIAMLAATPTVSRADDEWQIGTAPSFSSGKYGTETRTEVLQTPITARRLFDDGDITFVFPLTCVWGDSGVTVVNGTPVRTERIGSTESSTSGTTTDRSTGPTPDGRTGASSSPVRAAADVTGSPDATAVATSVSACGMGDIVVRGRYYLLDERAWMPTIAVRGHVKAPTASAERGLGTGRPDEGLALEISRTVAGGFMAMVDGGYTIIGKPAGAEFENNWWYDVGVGQTLAGGAANLSLFFSEYRAIVPGFANARDILVALSVKGLSGWRIQVAGQRGLSDGAPDHGVTFSAGRRF